MVTQLFGNYLVENSYIGSNQLEEILAHQKQSRVRLGLIAVSEKMMTGEQSEEVNRLQQVFDRKFGDIALAKGFLNQKQLDRLLTMQGNKYLSFVQAVLDKGFMKLEEVERAFSLFAESLGIEQDDIGKLKMDDSDRIVPLFLPKQCNSIQINHITMAVRTLIRLIDNDAYVGPAVFTSEIISDGIAVQSLIGDRELTLGFIGNEDSLLMIAVPFAREEFETVDLDALDSVAEFINCINGMYATKISPKLAVDMLPPQYKEGKSVTKGDKFICLPIFVNGKRLSLISSFDEMINL